MHRGNLNSKSPFQIQACGARIVAQKAIYAAYCNVTTEDMGTWQVRQKVGPGAGHLRSFDITQ